MDNTTSTTSPIPIAQLSLPDHDLLIKLDTKMDGLAKSFSQYYTDLTLRVSKLENRMDQEDIYHAAIDMPHFKNNSEWVDNYRANERFLLAFGGIIVSLCGGLAAIFISRLLHF